MFEQPILQRVCIFVATGDINKVINNKRNWLRDYKRASVIPSMVTSSLGGLKES